jgi:hypothetical protein
VDIIGAALNMLLCFDTGIFKAGESFAIGIRSRESVKLSSVVLGIFLKPATSS